MARLVHLNGPPGIGKSTLSARYADRHPGTTWSAGWQDDTIDTWPPVWSLVRAMAATHLDGGHDVVLPSTSPGPTRSPGSRNSRAARGGLSRSRPARRPAAAIERFNSRARDSDDPWICHHRRLIEAGGGNGVLAAMYDSLIEVVRRRPGGGAGDL
ncbi:ATP-binding protein [Actinoplanes awajinensis]|uniref:hypothetical protein n=1 Tax=Actinoplanes awajinensis TaxID=135946 RepID=UPI000A6C2C6D|nr:hypothetical protein [Actinoplanes awajinensis]